MSIRVHLVITNLFLFTTFFAFGGWLFFNDITKTWHPFVLFLIMVSVLSPAMILLRGHLLAARCPKCAKLRSYARGYRPVRYVCKSCGHLETTNFHYGRQDRFHN